MTATSGIGTTAIPASHVLGGKLDSIPFRSFHLSVILVLGFVALVDGYDGSMTGTLLVLAKKPLHITPGEIRLLAVASSLAACVGGLSPRRFPTTGAAVPSCCSGWRRSTSSRC
jgi:hypothetical protein